MSRLVVRSKQEFEDIKGIIKIRKSKKDRRHNGQKKKYKRTNNDLQDITPQAKYRVAGTPLKLAIQMAVLRKGEQFLLH
jgi:hypothetical protein